MIGISLGNSHLGRLAMDALMDLGVEPRYLLAVVRSPSKAQDLVERGIHVREAIYGEDAAMKSALEGVRALYMVSGMASPEERRKQHRGVVDAARKAGVEKVVYTSFLDTADDSPFFAWSINRDTERALAESGLDFTVLRNGMYSEADLDHVPAYLEAGKVENNIGDGLISYISRRDLALAAARCILDAGHEGRTYTLTGPEALSQEDLARAISRWTGQNVPYETVSDEAYRDTFPDAYWGDVVVTLYQSVRLGNCEAVTGDFAEIVGREPLTLDETWDRFYAGSES
jgi:NAD(P)H dehydrogenase (quinone)